MCVAVVAVTAAAAAVVVGVDAVASAAVAAATIDVVAASAASASNSLHFIVFYFLPRSLPVSLYVDGAAATIVASAIIDAKPQRCGGKQLLLSLNYSKTY